MSLRKKETDFAPRTIGEHVKKRRLELGLTQKAVARTLKVSQFSVIHWERGDFQPTNVFALYRVIRFLGYDPLPAGQTISDSLRAKRGEVGRGQRELAAHLGVNPRTVTDWELGGIILKRSHRTAVARLLGMNESRFIAQLADWWNGVDVPVADAR